MTTIHNRFPLPQGGAALPLTFYPSASSTPSTTLIIGTNKLAASRAYTFLDSGAKVVVAGSRRQADEGCEEIKWRIERGEVEWMEIPQDLNLADSPSTDSADLVKGWTTFLSTIPNLLLLTITDTLHIPFSSTPPRKHTSAHLISLACANLHIPINVTDTPSLCTFTFPSTHRFISASSPPRSSGQHRFSNLQISISTNGQGCRLASRIKREIVGKLSKDVGGAVDNIGVLRERVRLSGVSGNTGEDEGPDADGEVGQEAGDQLGGRGRRRDLTPTQTTSDAQGSIAPRRTSACRKLNPDLASSTSRARSPTVTPATALTTPASPRTRPPPFTTSTARSYSYSSSLLTDDDEASQFSTGPLNSPVPQLHAQAQSTSGTSTPGRLSRSGSGYFNAGGLGQGGNGSDENMGRYALSRAGSSLALSSSSLSVADVDTLEDLAVEGDAIDMPEPTMLAPPTLSHEEETLRRLRWVSQISEYWSIDYLAKMSGEEMDKVLDMWKDGEVGMAGPRSGVVGAASGVTSGGGGSAGMGSSRPIVGNPGGPSGGNSSSPNGSSGPSIGPPVAPRHDISLTYPQQPPALKQGKILLVGSGPGHPDLLTVAARKALETATLILSDKLVPAEVLALVPKTTELHIAKKFPGNAEGAQNEMMDLALQGARRGETVVRLKQGDPFVYGRGGEEVLFFRENGFESVVIPGVSSALAGPLMMNVPVTQRGVAESMVLCTGVGRKGKAVQLPGYVRSRSLVVLMGVARIKQVLQVLLRPESQAVEDIETQGWRDGAAFPPYLPIAIIERASSHDQRMVASTLENIEDALERSGEQRPPGMMIIGWAVLALEGKGDVKVLDDDEQAVDAEERDRKRVATWLDGRDYLLKDGLIPEWRSIAETPIELV